MSLSSHYSYQPSGVLQKMRVTPSWLPRRESLLPTVLPVRLFASWLRLLVRNKLHGGITMSDFSFSCNNSISVGNNNPASSALPIVVAPSHATPQLSQSQPVTSPVALNESDSSARVQAPPSEHPPHYKFPEPNAMISVHLASYTKPHGHF